MKYNTFFNNQLGISIRVLQYAGSFFCCSHETETVQSFPNENTGKTCPGQCCSYLIDRKKPGIPEKPAAGSFFPLGNLPVFFQEGNNQHPFGLKNAEGLMKGPVNITHEADGSHHQDTVKYPVPVRQELSVTKNGFQPTAFSHCKQPGRGVDTVSDPKPG